MDPKKEILSAVLIPESFTKNFYPISSNLNEGLLPLVNSPCLDYTLKWLKSVDVTHVYLCCKSNHVQQIKDECKHSITSRSGFNVEICGIDNLSSVGEALRYLDGRAVIKCDFILISGNVISNINLKELMDQHIKKRKENSNIVMSCVYLCNYERTGEEPFLTATLYSLVDSRKMLFFKRYPKATRLPIKAKFINLAVDNYDDIEILHRVQDPAIAFCSENVLSLFSDNFDYTTRDSLIHDIIEQEDLHGYAINVIFHNKDNAYGINIERFLSLVRASKHLMERKYYPMVVEKSPSTLRMRYKFKFITRVYHHLSANFNEYSVNESVIDAASNLHETCSMRQSVVGRHCEVDKSSIILGCIIEDHVKIGRKCVLKDCYLAQGCQIKDGCSLGPGIVVGPGVIVNEKSCILKEARIVRSGTTDEETEPLENHDKSIVSIKLNDQYTWSFPDPEEEKPLVIKEDSIDGGIPDSSDEELEEVSSNFIRETKESLLNGFKEKSQAGNVILEINSSRHAYNVPLEDVLKTVVKAVLEVGEKNSDVVIKGKKGELWEAMKKGINYFSEVLTNYVKNAKDQLNLLIAIEECIDENESYLAIAPRILYEFNQELEIADEKIMEYFIDTYEKHTESFPNFKLKIKAYMEWLKKQEEEESDEE